LVKGADLLVEGSSSIAKKYHISSMVIGLTIVAFGTSAPELVLNVIAGFRNAPDMAIGNIIGSNIFNILAVVGITSIITPISANDSALYTHDIYWMLGISLILPLLVFLPKKMQLERRSGVILLLLYGLFLYQTIS
jgi:cation:H+ antiporter